MRLDADAPPLSIAVQSADHIHGNIAMSNQPTSDSHSGENGDLSDMLSELRVLLPGAQVLTAFLIILPFNPGFRQINPSEKLVFLATFFLALISLVLLSAPAVQHRLMRPLHDRARFKRMATREIMVGSLALAGAFILGTNLVISQVFDPQAGLLAAGVIAVLILCVWLLLPLYFKHHQGI
jgi:hypothetical protein